MCNGPLAARISANARDSYEKHNGVQEELRSPTTHFPITHAYSHNQRLQAKDTHATKEKTTHMLGAQYALKDPQRVCMCQRVLISNLLHRGHTCATKTPKQLAN